MINLMYVVLMAMLALNVSNEVLNGFSIVEESLKRTTANAERLALRYVCRAETRHREGG